MTLLSSGQHRGQAAVPVALSAAPCPGRGASGPRDRSTAFGGLR
jgi:hypothetical protein